MYHGTNSIHLPKIFQLGMIPDPSGGRWKGDKEFEDTTINSPSMHSLKGSYWTDNVTTAYSSARDTLGGTDGRQMIVVAQLVPQTAKADEDDVRPVVEQAFREAYQPYHGARNLELAATMIHAQVTVDNNIYTELVNSFAKIVHDRLKTSDKMPFEPDFFRSVFDATLNRALGHVNWEQHKWYYIEAYQRALEDTSELDYEEAREEALKLKDNMPTFNKVSGEKQFLRALDKVSRRYRKSAMPTPEGEWRLRTNLRITEPVGFSGRNKIIAIVVGHGRKLEVVYGKVPEKFIKDYAKSWGPNFEIIDRKGNTIHKSKLKESKQVERHLEEKLALKSYKDFCSHVADAYDELPDYDAEAVASYQSLIQHVEKMYQRMLSKVKVEFVPGQPYNSQKEMSDKVKETGILEISTDYNEHDVFTPEQNLKLRAVHDYIVHILAGVDFSDKGEVAAFNAHAKLLPPKAIPAAFTEIVGQACYANARGEFPKQKIAIMQGFDFKNVGKLKGYKIQKKDLVKDDEETVEAEETEVV